MKVAEEVSPERVKKNDGVSFETDSLQTPQSAKSLQSLQSSCSSVGSITYGSQGQLPRLPVPTLEATLEKLPKVLEALQDEQEREETKRVVKEFLTGPGPVLQQALIDYEAEAFASGTFGSYVEDFWNECYLAPDSSVVLNLNPFFVLEQGPDPKVATDQLHRAASLCFAALKIASQLKDETLPPDTFKGVPLCMDQYKVLFGSSRQPAMHKSDDVHVYTNSSHGKLAGYQVYASSCWNAL
jgi:carnitine O-acetyltransferase